MPRLRIRRPARVNGRRDVITLVACAIIAVFAVTAGVAPSSASYSAITGEGGTSFGARSCYPKEVQDNPLFHYSFNEPSGATVEDGSGNGRDALLRGTTSRQTVGCSTTRAGPYAYSDGTPTDGGGTVSMVVTQGAAAVAPSTFTVETWFRTWPGAGGIMLGYGNDRTGGSPSQYDRMLYVVNGHVYFGLCTTVGCPVSISNSAVYDDYTWHMVQGVVSSGGAELYVDGALIASNSSYHSGTTDLYSGWWRIGRDRGDGWGIPTNEWIGDLDDVAVYGAPLTAAQVAAHFAAGR